jgi:hypothetical protein
MLSRTCRASERDGDSRKFIAAYAGFARPGSFGIDPHEIEDAVDFAGRDPNAALSLRTCLIVLDGCSFATKNKQAQLGPAQPIVEGGHG